MSGYVGSSRSTARIWAPRRLGKPPADGLAFRRLRKLPARLLQRRLRRGRRGDGQRPPVTTAACLNRMASTGQTSTALRAWPSSACGIGPGAHDGIAPVVEANDLGQQLGAHAVAVAGDPVDHELRGRLLRSPRGIGIATPDAQLNVHLCRSPCRNRVASPALLVTDEVVAEDAQAAAQEADRAIRVTAGSPAGDLPAPALDPSQVVQRVPTRRQGAPLHQQWLAARRRTARTGRRWPSP